MIPLDTIAAFIAISLVIIAIPGPSVLFAISRALVLGRKGAVLTVVGNGIGVFVQAVTVAVGVGILIQENEVLLHGIRLAGAAFLLYLGVQAIRHRREGIDFGSEAPALNSQHIMRESFIVGISNPKTIVFFSAIFPQFVNPAWGSIPVQMLQLGVIFVFFGISGDAVYAFAAGAARDWFAGDPKRVVIMRTIGGSAMVILAIVTAVLPA
ncbi:MAG: Homoserine/homoserine lactone efflux protein [Actinomycetota bacterium]|jgi:threonine/homoserine/homoserine lactone efflux protein